MPLRGLGGLMARDAAELSTVVSELQLCQGWEILVLRCDYYWPWKDVTFFKMKNVFLAGARKRVWYSIALGWEYEFAQVGALTGKVEWSSHPPLRIENLNSESLIKSRNLIFLLLTSFLSCDDKVQFISPANYVKNMTRFSLLSRNCRKFTV